MRADVILEFLPVLPHRLDGVHGQRLLPAHRQLADRQRQFGVDLGAMETQHDRRTGHGMAPRRERCHQKQEGREESSHRMPQKENSAP